MLNGPTFGLDSLAVAADGAPNFAFNSKADAGGCFSGVLGSFCPAGPYLTSFGASVGGNGSSGSASQLGTSKSGPFPQGFATTSSGSLVWTSTYTTAMASKGCATLSHLGTWCASLAFPSVGNVVFDGKGSTYFNASAGGASPLSFGGPDVVGSALVKYDANKKFVWQGSYPLPTFGATDGYFVVNGATVERFDGNAASSWKKTFPVALSLGRQVAAKDDTLLGALETSAAVDLGGGALAPIGTKDVVLARFGTQGAHLASKRFGVAGATLTAGVMPTDDGAVVRFKTVGKLDVGGGPVTLGAGDSLIVRFDGSLKVLWQRVVSGCDFSIATGVNGHVILHGPSQCVGLGVGPAANDGDNGYWLTQLVP